MTVESVPSPPGRTVEHKALGPRLSLMFFLQYAMLGIWSPVLGRYLGAAPEKGGLGFGEVEIGLIFGAAGSIGALAAPFIAGQIADRYFRTERLLAALLPICGLIWWAVSYQTTFGAWLLLLIPASLAAAPTMALSNSLAFSHMTDARRQFPRVRVWGTIGWIVVAWTFPMVWLRTDLHAIWKPPFLTGREVPDVTRHIVDAMKAGGIIAAVYAIYCLSLPRTAPKRDAREPLAFRKAFGLFRRRSFAVLMGGGLLIASTHQIYFIQTSKFLPTLGLADADILPAMSVGQIAEILVMAMLGLLLRRLGFRKVLAIGAASYLVRFTVFGTTQLPLGLIIASQALHGVGFACFYATAFIYVDRLADEDVRHSAQTVLGILLGIGPILGGLLNGALGKAFTPAGGKLNYSAFWYSVAGIGLVATIILASLFRDETGKAKR